MRISTTIRFCAPCCNCIITRILTAIFPQLKLSLATLCKTFVNRLATFSNLFIRRTWREAWRAKEDVRAKRTNDALSARTRSLRTLRCDDQMFIQNQRGRHPRSRTKSALAETLDFELYNVKMGKSDRITRRNRRFFHLMPDVAESPQTSLPPSVPPDTKRNFNTHPRRPPTLLMKPHLRPEITGNHKTSMMTYLRTHTVHL